MQPSLVISTALIAVGMFLLSVGGDALKIADSGIRFVPVQWLAASTTLSYRAVGYTIAITGFALTLCAAEICRRADKRVVSRLPGLPSPRSFRFAVVPGAFFAILGWEAVNTWFRA